MKVTFPTGQMIGPGMIQIHTERFEEEEVWFMGHLIETKLNKIEEIHGLTIPDPGQDSNGDAMRGEFTFADRTWIVIRDDDHEFWNVDWDARKIFSGGKQGFIERMRVKHDIALQFGKECGWWNEWDEQGNPIRPAQKISIADMVSNNKPLMAHLMVDLGFFPSVGQARKNGWDKPLELGRHELGPRKKRAIVELVP